MKTDELVTMLATNAGAVASGASARRYTIALGWGALGATLLMLILLGMRTDLGSAARLPMFWIKLAFPVAVAVASLVAASRLSRPGARLGRIPAALAAPLALMWILAAYVLLDAPPGDREALIMGSTLQNCLSSVPKLALPVLIAVLWAMKGLAPTRLVLAGSAAGLLAGAIGTAVYALHCPEMDAPFLGLWYAAAMLIPAAAGALLGPFVLRW